MAFQGYKGPKFISVFNLTSALQALAIAIERYVINTPTLSVLVGFSRAAVRIIFEGHCKGGCLLKYIELFNAVSCSL